MLTSLRPCSPLAGATHRTRGRAGCRPGGVYTCGMQGILVVVVPVLLAGFALLMDRFESAILAEPDQVDL